MIKVDEVVFLLIKIINNKSSKKLQYNSNLKECKIKIKTNNNEIKFSTSFYFKIINYFFTNKSIMNNDENTKKESLKGQNKVACCVCASNFSTISQYIQEEKSLFFTKINNFLEEITTSFSHFV